jgi:hypothetical protein
MIRSRRARPEPDERPLYARMLGLRHVTPSGFLCFVFLEGAVALGFLLALAELVSWWGVVVLPITVAVMVKLNDVVAGALARADPVPAGGPSVVPVAPPATRQVVRPAAWGDEFAMDDRALAGARTVDLRNPDGRAPTQVVTGSSVARPWVEELEMREQRARQSAARRYE